MDILEVFKKQQIKDTKPPELKTGDVVRVHNRLKEGQKTRTQVFEGTVLGVRGSGPSTMATVRRISGGFSVERIFPLSSPLIEKIEIVRHQKVRRAKLTYLRNDSKRRRIKQDTKATEAAEGAPEIEAEAPAATAAQEPAAEIGK